MRQRSALKRHGNQMLLSVIDALANSLRDFSGLADAGADAARAIADYHKSRKAEVTTALYDLGNAIYGYHLLLELASLFVALHPIFLLLSLEVQPAGACAIGDFLNATGVHIAAAVKHNRSYALGLGALGYQLAYQLGSALLIDLAELVLELGIQRGSRSKRVAGHIIDDLSIDVVQAAVYAQARTFGRAD